MLMAVIMMILARHATDDSRSMAKWLELLNEDDGLAGHQILVNAAPTAIDDFEKILNDPKTDRFRLGRLYSVLAEAKIDHNRFLKPAFRDLQHKDPIMRGIAAHFLGKVGSPRETGPLLVLLSDSDISVVFAALYALGKIGDDRTIVALNLWQRFNNDPKDYPKDQTSPWKTVNKVRDEIQARLDTTKKTPPVAPMPKN